MANSEHLSIALKGTRSVNEWQTQNEGKILDLSYGKLSGVDLTHAHLINVDLTGADLGDANLREANFTKAKLDGANLAGTNLNRCHFLDSQACEANFANADLFEVSFTRANLSGSNLRKAQLLSNSFLKTDLSGSDFTEGSLLLVSFLGTDLSKVNFSSATLEAVYFMSAKLDSTVFHGATIGASSFCYCNLSGSIGLGKVKHSAPNSVGFDTIERSFRSAGDALTPEVRTFLIDSGVHSELLEMVPRILAKVRYCTCFVCYGSPDEEFAKELVKDLKARGVVCWLYPLDYTVGQITWKEITQKRRDADKMVILCSAKSLIRPAVKKEIEEQVDEDRTKIVPVSLDKLWREEDFQVETKTKNLKPFLLELNMACFDEPSKYDGELKKILNCLAK